jgi:histone deacetylase complex regulatory component SIN3
MAKIIFRVKRAGEMGRSEIEIVLENNGKKYNKTVEHTDFVLSVLDTLLKKSKIELESVKDIKIETHKEAGLTSTRIIKSIIKALAF